MLLIEGKMEPKYASFGLQGKRITLEQDNQEIARISVIYIKNDLHEEPYGLIEDLYIDESFRGKGLARKLFEAAIQTCKEQGCYKIVATSRYSRTSVHDFYLRLGFKDYGKEFRLDFEKK